MVLYHKKSGFTLIELCIVVIIIGIVASIIVKNCGSSKVHANNEAREYAKDMGMEIIGLSCVDQDSDNDGYVSCSLSTKEQGIVAIECAHSHSMNSGCRVVPVMKR